ncbi:hypothetical protein EON65_04845 [archaeon]|nr:MAG: hypothetical protein EON65_04845 [archaeon]
MSPSRVHSEEMQLQLRVEAAKETVGESERRNAIVEATSELEKTRARVMRLKVGCWREYCGLYILDGELLTRNLCVCSVWLPY